MSADNTAPKQQVGRPFEPGQSGNPKGRPLGARNKLGEQFLEDMYADWQANGAEAIVRVRTEKPDQYLKVVASILPKELNVNVNEVDSLTDEQLVERIRALDAAIRPYLELEAEGDASGGVPKATTH